MWSYLVHHHSIYSDLSLWTYGAPLRRFDKVKDLWVLIDSERTFKKHIDHTVSRAKSTLNLMKQLAKSFSFPYVTKSNFQGTKIFFLVFYAFHKILRRIFFWSKMEKLFKGPRKWKEVLHILCFSLILHEVCVHKLFTPSETPWVCVCLKNGTFGDWIETS